MFADYNVAIGPAPLAAYALGLGAVASIPARGAWSDRAVLAVMAAMWLWTGVAYHWLFFARINAAAYLFGALFVGQGLLFAHAAAAGRALRFAPRGALAQTALGWTLIGYAALAYPIIGWWAGFTYPGLPLFGVTPCPLTLFTLGFLLLAPGPVPGRLLVVPALWSVVGGTAAFLLSVPQDWLLLVGGSAAAALLACRGGARA